MKIQTALITCFIGIGAISFAQDAPDRPPREGRPGGPGGPGGPGPRFVMPLMQALDANTDGTLDESEIANATVALKKLDKNGDGKLTGEELRPPRPDGTRGGPGGPGGGPGGGRGGQGGEGPRPRPPGNQ